MSIQKMEIDKKAEGFVDSQGFYALCDAMGQVINMVDCVETVGALAQVVADTFVVSFAKGGRGGYGIQIAKLSDISHTAEGKMITHRSGFPEVNIRDGKISQQISMQTGSIALSEYQFSPDLVVQDSSRIVAVKAQKVREKYGSLDISDLDAILLQIQYGGGVKYYERPYRGKWGYSKNVSDVLESYIKHTSLSSEVTKIT